MRLRTLPACIGAALLAISIASVASAGASSSSQTSSQVAALKRVGVSWALFTNNGNAPKACRLQVEENVGGVPCDQLPTYNEILYCPEDQGPPYPPTSWRDAAEIVVKVRVMGRTGSLVIRASSKGSKKSGKASFVKIGGKWRIASFQSSGRTFAPAGLIFTEGNDIRKALWPLHC
jgi:hypothetical protein